MEYTIGCWLMSVLVVPLFVFTLRAVTDESTRFPRFWQRPSSYGQALFIAAALWSFGWIAPALWGHRFAFDTTDSSERERLSEDLIPLGPLSLGILLFGGGLWLATTAWTGSLTAPRCRHCDKVLSATPNRKPGRTCPSCGAKLPFLASLAFASPRLQAFPLLAGTLLMLAGWYAAASEAGPGASFLLLALLIPPAPLLFSAAAHRRPGLPPVGACRRCHYNLSGLAPGIPCPECGAPR